MTNDNKPSAPPVSEVPQERIDIQAWWQTNIYHRDSVPTGFVFTEKAVRDLVAIYESGGQPFDGWFCAQCDKELPDSMPCFWYDTDHGFCTEGCLRDYSNKL
jgi:hypothetical protein